MTHNTPGLAIKHQKYKENDRIYTIYTRDFGKLTVLARGSNKIKSKLAGHLEPCVLSNIMVAEGKYFDILAQAKTINSFRCVRQIAHRFLLATVVLDALDKLTEIHQKDEEVFLIAIKTLQRMNVAQNPSINLIYWYLLHILIKLGHAPDMQHQEKLEDLLVADIDKDDIILADDAKFLVEQYLKTALDEKQMLSLEFLISQNGTFV